MSSELLAILDHIERERGINKDVLIQAVESAMVSAVKKVVGAKTSENIRVTIDRADGKIHAYIDEAEIKSVDFGRIAAQTAKQVIIQKIREAEKEVVFGEFQGKVGEIVSGTVYRFEKKADEIIIWKRKIIFNRQMCIGYFNICYAYKSGRCVEP